MPLNKIGWDGMGWTFKWVSSFGSDFNRDFHVTFTPEQVEQGTTCYNYENKPFPVAEAPGVSAFCKDKAGDIFHTRIHPTLVDSIL